MPDFGGPFDAIVIGSGISGLTSANLLARSGHRVLLLEQHYIFGGYMQRFYLHKTGFDSGCHYVGALGRDQVFDRYLRDLGVRDQINVRPLDPDGFDVLHLPDRVFRMAVGYDAYEARLVEHFPHQAAAVAAYLAELRDEVSHFPMYALTASDDPRGRTPRPGRTLQAALDDAGVTDPELLQVLCAHTMLHFVHPRECPLTMHAFTTDSYIQGAYTIDGGGQALANALVKRLRGYGAVCKRRCRVEQLVVDDRTVRGVVLADGRRAEAPLVIAAIDPKVVVQMLPEGAVRKVYRNRIERMRTGTGGLAAYLRVEGDLSRFAGGNRFLFGNGGVENFFEERWVDDPAIQAPVFITVPSAREPGRTGPHAVKVLSGMRAERWARWADTTTGERGPAYDAYAARIRDRLVAAARTVMPEVDTGLVTADFASPLTHRDYTLNSDGAIYGLHHSVDQVGPRGVSWRTRVRGLMLAGHSVLFPGLLGAGISGYYACGEVLGLKVLHNRVRQAS